MSKLKGKFLSVVRMDVDFMLTVEKDDLGLKNVE